MRRSAIRDRATLCRLIPVSTVDADTGEVIITGEEDQTFTALVIFASSETDAALYGQRVRDVRKVYAASITLNEGDHIRLNDDNEDADYIVIKAARYPQETIYDIGKRGVFGG